MAKVLTLFDAASGAILRPLLCSLFVHEALNVWGLHPQLRGGERLVQFVLRSHRGPPSEAGLVVAGQDFLDLRVFPC